MEELEFVQTQISSAVHCWQNERIEIQNKVARLAVDGSKDVARDYVSAYQNKLRLHLDQMTLTLIRCKGNRVTWLVNLLTFGENKKAQDACFGLMEQYIEILKRELEFSVKLEQSLKPYYLRTLEPRGTK